MEWIDNADSYICPVCRFETDNPNKFNRICPSCGFVAEQDKQFVESLKANKSAKGETAMDAVEFLKEWRRACNKKLDCEECSLFPICNPALEPDDYTNDEIENIVSAVEQWSKENPVKTRQSEFLKMFPKAELCKGILHIDPCVVNQELKQHCDMNCSNDCRRNYWLQVVE